jgi:hydrogenase maturation protease
VSEGGVVRVVGLGNTLAGDDAVGVLAARRLKAVPGLAAEVVDGELAALEVLDWMGGSRAVILIDAVRSGGLAGSIRRLDASTEPLPRSLFPHSTHAFNAADAVELGRTLGLLPPTVVLYGVEIGSADAGAALSPAVTAALPALVERVAQEVAALRDA